MLVTAVYGFKFMKCLNYVAVPALLLMCLYGMVNMISNKYRMAKIKERFDGDVSMMPASGALYQALALDRLFK